MTIFVQIWGNVFLWDKASDKLPHALLLSYFYLSFLKKYFPGYLHVLKFLDVKPWVQTTGGYTNFYANEGPKVVIYMYLCWQIIMMMEILVAIIVITTFDDPINSKPKKNADTDFACKIVTPFPSVLQ